MSTEIECPSCHNTVWPDVRKLRGVVDAKERVGSPILSFANYCPVVDCNFRLDDAIEAQKNAAKAEFLPEENEPTNLPVLPAKKTEPNQVVPIRQNRKESEDLFIRIPREHAEAVREEGELRSRLADVVTKREKLDRIMAAISDIQAPIAAE
jgi:hypothetical protein